MGRESVTFILASATVHLTIVARRRLIWQYPRDSLWQRFMAKVVAADIERFTEHDIRAKVGSDAESIERAREILTHAPGSTITDRVYRRKPDRIRPLR